MELTLAHDDDPAVGIPTSKGFRSSNPISDWQAEFDGYYREMNQFSGFEIDQIFMRLAAYTARASEVRSQLVRMQSRAANSFRTQEVDPFLVECDRQFKIWSRLVTVMGQEIDLAGKVV